MRIRRGDMRNRISVSISIVERPNMFLWKESKSYFYWLWRRNRGESIIFAFLSVKLWEIHIQLQLWFHFVVRNSRSLILTFHWHARPFANVANYISMSLVTMIPLVVASITTNRFSKICRIFYGQMVWIRHVTICKHTMPKITPNLFKITFRTLPIYYYSDFPLVARCVTRLARIVRHRHRHSRKSTHLARTPSPSKLISFADKYFVILGARQFSASLNIDLAVDVAIAYLSSTLPPSPASLPLMSLDGILIHNWQILNYRLNSACVRNRETYNRSPLPKPFGLHFHASRSHTFPLSDEIHLTISSGIIWCVINKKLNLWKWIWSALRTAEQRENWSSC